MQKIGNFVGALAECWVFFLLAGGLQYVAAATSFPFADDAFLKMDKVLGFSWHAYADWVEGNPLFYTVFDIAYWSFFHQIIVLFFVHSMKGDSKRNAELLWGLMISLLICSVISMVFPAVGYPGEIGQRHIDILVAARNGVVLGVAGIITFPSFHAVMGVLFAYSARTFRPLFLVFIPLNGFLIIATPPFGGHYFIDVIGGIAVASFTIHIMRGVKRISQPLTWAIRTKMEPST